MSFRSADAKETRPTLQITDLTAGNIVNGTVKKIEDYGLFIEIEGSRLRGLCHKSEVRTNSSIEPLPSIANSLESSPITRKPMSPWLFEASEKEIESRLSFFP